MVYNGTRLWIFRASQRCVIVFNTKSSAIRVIQSDRGRHRIVCHTRKKKNKKTRKILFETMEGCVRIDVRFRLDDILVLYVTCRKTSRIQRRNAYIIHHIVQYAIICATITLTVSISNHFCRVFFCHPLLKRHFTSLSAHHTSHMLTRIHRVYY